MSSVMPGKLLLMSKSSDPKSAILDAVGDAVENIHPTGSRILVGTYISPEKSSGGIIFSDQTKMEDLWQGCMGLVLKKGPTAFQDDDLHKFHDFNVEEGQWILFRFSSAWEFHLNGASCRMVPDTEIMAVIDTPSIITSRPRVPGL